MPEQFEFSPQEQETMDNVIAEYTQKFRSGKEIRLRILELAIQFADNNFRSNASFPVRKEFYVDQLCEKWLDFVLDDDD